MKNNYKNQANAMLASIVLSSVLLVIGLGVSQAILRQIRVQYDYASAQQAYYSAQAAVEDGLLALNNNLPGYELLSQADLNGDEQNDYNLNIRGQEADLPCEQDQQDDGWYELGVQESFKVPLFVAGEDGKQIEINDFVVEFFVDRPEAEAKFIATSGDVLKWSVMGIHKEALDKSGYVSESMQAYIPMAEGKVSESSPTAFGTSADLPVDNYSTAQYYQPDSYGGSSESTKYIFYDRYPIATFLEEHVSSYLIIQNIIDLDKQVSSCDDANCNTVKFRIVSVDESVNYACQTALIEVDGFADNLKQSLDVSYSRADFLPVFDFALFQIGN